MRNENALMKKLLADAGIKATPRYLVEGSCKGRWMIYNAKTTWWNNIELQYKMTVLGFVDFDKKPLSNYSGNGGVFSVMVYYNGNNENVKRCANCLELDKKNHCANCIFK